MDIGPLYKINPPRQAARFTYRIPADLPFATPAASLLRLSFALPEERSARSAATPKKAKVILSHRVDDLKKLWQ